MRVAFDRFTFDSDRRELLDQGKPVHLGPKAFRALEILIGERPRAIEKQKLYDAIWDDAVVDESNLAGLINELRAALKDRTRKIIRTVHGFGYAFAGEAQSPAAFVTVGHKRFPLREGANVLGRDPSVDVHVDDSTVSRRHAVITIAGEVATLEDLASKNGTFIGDDKLEAVAKLREGQRFVLGDVALTFRTSASRGSTISVSRLRKKRA